MREMSHVTVLPGFHLQPSISPSMEQSMEQSIDIDFIFSKAATIIKKHLEENGKREASVVKFTSPTDLLKVIDFSLPTEPESHDKLLEYVKKVLEYSIQAGHPRYFNQLYSGLDHNGMVAQMISAATNCSVATFEIAPVYTTIERIVLDKMCSMVGYKDGDGIFSPGGSISNLYGLLCARHRLFPDVKRKGNASVPQLVIFTSEQAHYSIQKSAVIMGIGTDNVITIKCDDRGKMLAVDLEKAISGVKEEGKCPMAVSATAGTTVFGAFDSFTEIATICRKHNLWLHIDGALGGSALMSEKYKYLLEGSELSDSFAWNPHKALVVPQQCSAFLTKHKGLLAQCNSMHATYLFQQDKKSYDVTYDTGDKSIQCARLNDSFKLWFMWKAKGKVGFEMQIDKAIGNAKYLAERVKERDGFELLIEPEYTNCCFWYYPTCLRASSPPDPSRLTKVAPTIKDQMVKRGTMMVTYMPLGDKPNFFRMVTISPLATEKDMDYVLDEIDRIGRDLIL